MGNLTLELEPSDCSKTGDADEVRDELELGKRECPRTEKVGVGGVELSDTEGVHDSSLEKLVCNVGDDEIMSSIGVVAVFLDAMRWGKVSFLGSRMVIVDRLYILWRVTGVP
jgi:hypothetical protein